MKAQGQGALYRFAWLQTDDRKRNLAHMQFRRPRVWLLVACTLLLSAGGCDTTVTAFSGGDRYFSIFGYLDAAHSTQRVRVEALQDSMLVGADSTQVRATLEDLETGEAETMEEEVIERGGGLFLRNFRTGMDIRPGTTYRLSVERLRDGATSRAEVTIPEHAPEMQFSGGTSGGTVIVRGIEHLGALVALYSDGQRSHLADTTRLAEGVYRVILDARKFGPRVQLRSVTAASVSEDWPAYAFPVGDPEPLPPAGAVTNVEHGLGYVGGAITRTVSVQ